MKRQPAGSGVRRSAPAAGPRFFATPAAFRAWLAKHHATARELLVGFHKVDSGKPSMTWPQSVDEALCFGWIDGVRRSLGATSYTIRFSPRRPGSIWSVINTRRMQELQEAGRAHPAGLAVFERRNPERTNRYSFEQENVAFEPAMEKRFRANRGAWSYFQAQPPFYRRVCTWYVVSAKRDETRARRLETLIACSARNEWLPGFIRPGSKAKGKEKTK